MEQTLVQMTGTQDSEAHFLARASQYGLPTPFVDRLKAEGVATMGQQLAFAIFRPGAEFEERAFDDWATNINNGTPLALGAAAALRRLHFESEEVMTLPYVRQWRLLILLHQSPFLLQKRQPAWTRCEHVSKGSTYMERLKLDASALSIKETKSVPDESMSTTFHLSLCLKRRALAYEFANLISFKAHELYMEKLLKHLSSEPPINYQATTLAQVLSS